ncbi:ATP-binding protein [Streptomyces otsuchiensis]|uniref:ATP-binding protein n=1 Tax=Streptomyces otsuchiensis TaxID=2681388 RepID=UPI0010300601|nr:ATP-binding protein [Streptomyces otsuchiensis]
MDEYTSKVRVWELLCPGLPAEVGRAKRWTRDVLTGHPHAEDAALIVTELVTNAVTHTTTPDVRLTLRRAGAAISLTVTDHSHSDTEPRHGRPTDDATHGRGLLLAHLLAAAIQLTTSHTGHTVTAHLTAPPEAAPC